MSRQDRCKEYSNPLSGPQGAGRDQANLDAWSDRATANSQIAPRAKGGSMKLPSTGKSMADRSTSMKPYARRGDVIEQAKSDKNFAGNSDYMRGIRRDA